MKQIRKLPIGIQSFEDLRKKKFLYVDKTRYIWELLETGKTYFLSRPRRFGKSLLVSTMEAYFLGKKELFEGLDIAALENGRGDDAWLEYPVILFSLSGGSYNTEEGLSKTLDLILSDIESHYEINRKDFDLPNRFRNALKKIYESTGRQVVVLVDEYDKPLLETMGSGQEKKNRELYKSFFSVLKDQDQYLKFVFFTGVTKFSKVSIFSDLNQLKDISLTNKYSGICGITGNELKDNFDPEIAALADSQDLTREECEAKLAKTYDGYHFSKISEGVYNPFSLLNAFADQDFSRYWFETGTPTFLIKRLQKSNFSAEQFTDGVESTEAELKDYRTENPNPVPLFYQSGYLTIAGYDKRFGLYCLKFPNEEVRYGFFDSLIPYVLGETDAEMPYSASAIVLALESGDTDKLHDQLYSLFASIPYIEGKALNYEGVWRNQIYLIFALLGQFTECEVHTSLGRCDCIIKTGKYIYIMEFKVRNEDLPAQNKTIAGTSQAGQDDKTGKRAQDALSQIFQKDYAGKYLADPGTVIQIGAVFSGATRNITEWSAVSKPRG